MYMFNTLGSCYCVIGSWGRMDSRWCNRNVSFVFEQSGAPFPARKLIILFTRCPELSAVLNCAGHDRNLRFRAAILVG